MSAFRSHVPARGRHHLNARCSARGPSTARRAGPFRDNAVGATPTAGQLVDRRCYAHGCCERGRRTGRAVSCERVRSPRAALPVRGGQADAVVAFQSARHFPRTLEILDMAGLVAPFMEIANRVTSVAVAAHGHTLARVRFEPDDTPYSFMAIVPQNVTEQLLADHFQQAGGRAEYDTSFISAVQRRRLRRRHAGPPGAA